MIFFILFLVAIILIGAIVHLTTQFAQDKAAVEIRQTPVYRYLTQHEKDLLKDYINNMKKKYEVRLISGHCQKRHDILELSDNNDYYTLGNLEIIFPYPTQIQYIAQYNHLEIVSIGSLNIVVNINSVDLDFAYIHHQEMKQRDNAWQTGESQQYQAIHIQQAADGRIDLHFNYATENSYTESYTIISQRPMSRTELNSIPLKYISNKAKKDPEYRRAERNQRLLVISCMAILFTIITIDSWQRINSVSGALFCSLLVIGFSSLFIYLQYRLRIIDKQPINRIKGYLTAINKTERQIEISRSIWCTYPIFWDKFIPKIGTFIEAEMTINSHLLVSLNQLSLQKEANTIGAKQYFTNIIWITLTMLGSSIFFSTIMLTNDSLFYLIYSYSLIGINIALWIYLFYKLYLQNKRDSKIDEFYRELMNTPRNTE